MTLLRRLARWSAAAGLAAAAVAPASAAAISGIWGREVLPIVNPYDEVVLAGNRIAWSPGDPVAPIYGQPSDRPIRVVFPRADRILVPSEDPTLTLYKIDKRLGENPLQAQTLWFFAKWIALAGATLALAGGAGLLVARRAAGRHPR